MPRSHRLDQVTKTERKNLDQITNTEGKNDDAFTYVAAPRAWEADDEHSRSLTALRFARPRVRHHRRGASLPTPALGPVRRYALRADHPLRPEGRDRASRDRRCHEYADVAAQGRRGAGS